MAKRKLERFAEVKSFPNVVEAMYHDVISNSFAYKSNWGEKVFGNNHKLILELGCGKGEYTTGLAEKYPDNNFIGIDIKGARIWRGAKTALEKNLRNVFFLRTRIELIESFFASGEVSEIWITFPDPQPKKPLKRLTSSRFLTLYQKILIPSGIINLKTDNADLYYYTLGLLTHNYLEIIENSEDLYNSKIETEARNIQTFYENQFIKQNKSIKYLKFTLPHDKKIFEPEDKKK